MTMKSLVVYESKFGDTAQVAQAVADGLHASGGVHLLSVQDAVAFDLDGIDLLVVGGPTHAHGVSAALGQWLASLPHEVVRDLPIAAFDTRYRMARLLSGSAARAIARRLERAGATVVAEPESFFVLGSQGPLADGEIARATAWAKGLAERCVAQRPALSTPAPGMAGEHWQPHP
jgi:flavodoxin